MKILHIITSLKVGGAEAALYHFLKEVQHDGHEHIVVYFYDGLYVERLKNLSIPIYHIQGLLRGYDPIGIIRLNSLIKKIKPDILHSALWAANIVSRLLGWWHTIPVINELHGLVIHEGFVRNTIDYLTADMPQALVAVSESVRVSYDLVIVQRMRLADRKQVPLKVIRNGVSVSALQHGIQELPLQRAEIGFLANDFVIGSIGRFEPIKSYAVLVRAVALLQKRLPLEEQKLIKLCLVGDGSQRALLESEVFRHGLTELVVFVGMRSDAMRFYPLFDCFALSSQSEGLSLALLEAMACGLPVVTTHMSMQHDAIVDGQHGFLVPVNNEELYAQALYRMFQLKKNVRAWQQIAMRNRDHVALHFALKNTAAQYLRLYETLLHHK